LRIWHGGIIHMCTAFGEKYFSDLVEFFWASLQFSPTL
jgi:hypothetical protein